MQTETNGATLRYTILGHVVRGGRPSAMDRYWVPDLGFQPQNLAMSGHTQIMVGWRPYEEGTPTQDPRVCYFALSKVLDDTKCLLDGTHTTTKQRMEMLAKVQNILLL